MGSKHSAVLVLAAAMLILCACTSPIPQQTSSPTHAPSPTPTQPSTEPPTASPPLTLHVDGLASVQVDELRRLLDPAHPRVHGGPNEEPSPLGLGEIAFLVDGPQQVGGRDYWQLAAGSGDRPIGWAPATDKDGHATLVPFQPTCPPVDDVSAAAIDALGGLQALACFGDRELTLSGQVECNRAIADGGVGGAPYFDSNRHCVLDDLLGVYGDAVTAILGPDPNLPTVSGMFELRGHMDDPGARGCGSIPIGVSLNSSTTPEPWAVVWCRQNFVVTAVVAAN
jgi:hypothetical protein